MKIKLKLIILHTPLFLAGVNCGDKLNPKQRPLEISYEEASQFVYVTLNNETAWIPLANVAAMIPDEQNATKIEPIPAHKGKVVAQVETPQDHVFKGNGHGKR